MAFEDLYIMADTGWRYEPRWAPQDVLDSDGTIFHHLSNPGPRRTISGYYKGDGSNYGAGMTEVSYGGATCVVLGVSAQRLQNVGATKWWRITIELQRELT